MKRSQTLLDSICQKGYFECKNHFLDEVFFTSLYKDFDSVIGLLNNEKNFAEANIAIERFCDNSAKENYFADITLGWNILKSPKRNTKAFMHYNERYHKYIRDNYSHLIKNYYVFDTFLSKISILHFVSENLYKKYIDYLSYEIPDLKSIIYNRDKLITYTKICVHHPEERITENSHVDWSGLTMIVHNDEIEGSSHLNIAPGTSSSHKNKYTTWNKSSTTINGNKYVHPLIFPGQALKKANININPSPHYVSSINRIRHSIITFCMVPSVECSFSSP